jgi:hypothetical protein
MTDQTEEPAITDHAVLRYLERVVGMNIQAIRDSILTPDRAQMIRMGARKIKIETDALLIIENKKIITVMRLT